VLRLEARPLSLALAQPSVGVPVAPRLMKGPTREEVAVWHPDEMHDVGFVRTRDVTASGQQRYELQLLSAFHDGRDGHPTWPQVVDLPIAPWGSAAANAHRVPMKLASLPSPAAQLAIRAFVPHCRIYHRCDLRLPPMPRREVLTIHDTAWVHFADEGAPPPSAGKTVRRAAAVIAPSAFAAEEIRACFGVEATVIHNGVDEDVWQAEPASENELAQLGLRTPFAFVSGGMTIRKNVTAVLDAWPTVTNAVPGVQLAVTGRLPATTRPPQGLVPLGLLERHAQLAVMAAAACVIVPSTYEGFGFPLLEAMALGVPVIASRRASLPELADDAAVLVDPDPRAFASAVVAALTRKRESTVLRERGRARASTFTWAASASAHMRIYEELLLHGASEVSPPQRREAETAQPDRPGEA
jgi:glycosyltransferase involved in cell wall biosynthesis